MYALILAGGKGTRFWPASRQGSPKHLLKLTPSGRSLLGETVDRLAGAIPPERVIVVTTAEQAPLVRADLPRVPAANVIAEPAGRDTAAALGLGAKAIHDRDPKALLVALPADHVIAPKKRFQATLDTAARLLAGFPEAVVTIGIQPTSPATGYGYLERGEALSESLTPAHSQRLRALPHRVYRVARFREKPDLATAQRYLAEGRYYWNGGIFAWRADAMLEALGRYLPKTRAVLDLAPSSAPGAPEPDAAAVARFAAAYAECERISIDFAVLEKHEQVLTIESDFTWSDVGSWPALQELFGEDAQGNTVHGVRHLGVGTTGTLVYGLPGPNGEDPGLVATVGVKDLVVVKGPDAVLVCAKEHAQEIKKLVAALEATEDPAR